jgi:hypothetical protein
MSVMGFSFGGEPIPFLGLVCAGGVVRVVTRCERTAPSSVQSVARAADTPSGDVIAAK